MKSFLTTLGAVTWALGLGLSGASAAPITYFGEDPGPLSAVPAGGNAETARLAFLGGLAGVGSEDFEAIAAGTVPPLALTFPGSVGSITATITSTSGGVCDTTTISVGAISCDPVFGRFPTSGGQYYHTTDVFTIDFSSPIAAFGFYATDIGDFTGQITATLTRSGGGTVDLILPHTVNGANASLLFWGFIDPGDTYTSIQFGNTAAGTDVFGFDDMVVGDLEQVTVPEPGLLTLLGLGAAAFGLRRHRRASVAPRADD